MRKLYPLHTTVILPSFLPKVESSELLHTHTQPVPMCQRERAGLTIEQSTPMGALNYHFDLQLRSSHHCNNVSTEITSFWRVFACVACVGLCTGSGDHCQDDFFNRAFRQ